MRTTPSFAFAALLGIAALPARAESDIDVVYGDEMTKRGEWATELAARWSQTSRGGSLAGRTLWQGVGELAYGVSDQFSVGIKVPISRVDGSWHGNGGYAEVKYLATHDTEGWYWGVEVEAGSIKPVRGERSSVLEAFPIAGYRLGRVHLTANPALEYTSEDEEKGWGFSPKAKISYRLNDAHALGIEYHAEAGKFGNFTPRQRRTETAYLTWDAKIAGQQLSLAIGHGTTKASDRWAFRVGIELDD